jgi:Arc/MetJ-type ribon-helix-helix transcriptional regulator
MENERNQRGSIMPMKNITVNIVIDTVTLIDKLVELKYFPSRSEVIRIAIREFLGREFNYREFLKFMIEKLEPLKPDPEVVLEEVNKYVKLGNQFHPEMDYSRKPTIR